MKEGWNVIVRYDAAFAGVNVWLIYRQGSKEVVVQPVDLTMTVDLAPNEVIPEPTLRFQGNDAHQFLQGLTEGLVGAGFKPDELKASDKQVAAIKDHLEDMRLLVFKERLPAKVSRK